MSRKYDKYDPKTEAEALALGIRLRPEKKKIDIPATMEIRLLGFVNTPIDEKEPMGKQRLTTVSDFEMIVKADTTVREVKDTILARLTSIRYFQLAIEFWNKVLADSCTLTTIITNWPWFMTVKCLHFHITLPDEMFKSVYESFLNMGINEEKSLMQTRRFIEKYQNKDVDHEYELAERLEKARKRLLKHGIVIRIPTPPPPCE